MGNHRFRLSDMMPNAWFYKLRDMSKSRIIHNPNSSLHKKLQQNPSPTSQPIINSRSKPSYQLQTNYKSSDNIVKNNSIDYPPTKLSSSKKKKPNRKTIYKPSPRKQPENSFPVWLKPPTVHDHDDFLEEYSDDSFRADDDACHDSCCTCKLITSSEADDDIIIDVDGGRINLNRFEEFNVVLEQELPPIRTKPAKVAAPKPRENETVPRAKKSKKTAARKSVSRVKIRGANVVSSSRRKSSSVKLGGGGGGDDDAEEKKKKGLFSYNSESFAIVKASFDPEADFRESMMEMIVENNIRASKELEDLLACYLSLNSNQYHDLIVKAFEQIWFNMPQLDFN